jgi:GxxExxY protein
MMRMAQMTANTPEIVEKELSYQIVAAFFYVYNALGFGFLEQIYARALEIVLRRAGLNVQREVPIPVMFDGEQIGFHRLDMLIDGRIAIEIKATEQLPNSAHEQLRNYLAALRYNGQPIRLGILLHFGQKPKFHRHLAVSRIRADSRHSSHSVVQVVPDPPATPMA